MGMEWKYVKVKLVKCFVNIISTFYSFILAWYYKGKKKTLPPISNQILLESATSLAEKIRTKKLKSKDVVQAFISRIEDINPILNCVIEKCFDEALEEAERVDDMIESGQISVQTMATELPFLGVPFSAKDSLAVKGCLWAAGLIARKRKVAEEDCEPVAMMRKSGAIFIAMTNVPELCNWIETWNNLYGRTNNPYDTTRTCGGSSGGEAALISAAGSPFGIGTDVGGSIRVPAFFNGIFGHKPSKGVVSNQGQYPETVGVTVDTNVTGPLCRFSTDLIPMLTCLSGPNLPPKISDKHVVDFTKLKIFYMENDGGLPFTTYVTTDLKRAQMKVREHFEITYRVQCQKVHFPQLEHIGEIFPTQLLDEGSPRLSKELSKEVTGGTGEINWWKELIKGLFYCSDHILPTIALLCIEKQSPELIKEGEVRLKYIELLNEFRAEVKRVLGDDGILLYPPHPRVAPYHSLTMVPSSNVLYTAVFNALQVPVTQCPLGLDSNGLPLGTQVVAAPNNDHLTLAVASELEKVFGGWVCPSIVE